jgi:glycosyltransferase involved in cell wall biosynthesis
MEILIVTQYFWPESFKINDLALALKERGHKITVLTGMPNYPEGKFYKGYKLFSKKTEYLDEIKIIRVPIIPRGNASGLMLFLNYFSFMIIGSIWSFFLSKKYETVIALNYSPITAVYPAIIYKMLHGTNLYLWVFDLWPESVRSAGKLKWSIVDMLLLRMVKSIYNKSNKILISSEGFGLSIIEKGVGEHKLVYMPNWAEAVFEDSSLVDEQKYSPLIPHGFIVMFAGNIGEAQDFDSILKAAELTQDFKDIKWVIIGDGRKREEVSKEIDKRGLGEIVFLLGRFPLLEMPSFFVHANVMLFSLKDEEIFSLTLPGKVQSYMAFGKPIAAMINGEGSAVISKSNCGFTCNAGDYQGLANNIIKAHEMPANELSTLGKNGYEYYKSNFAKEMLIDRFERILRNND